MLLRFLFLVNDTHVEGSNKNVNKQILLHTHFLMSPNWGVYLDPPYSNSALYFLLLLFIHSLYLFAVCLIRI